MLVFPFLTLEQQAAFKESMINRLSNNINLLNTRKDCKLPHLGFQVPGRRATRSSGARWRQNPVDDK